VELSVKKDKYFDNTYTENYVSELIIPPSKFGPTLSPCKNGNEHWVSKNKILELPDLIIYVITQCSRVLLENLTSFQLVKKFTAFYGTQRFITAFTSARHLSLS